MKYRNKKVKFEGIIFDSKKEANRYQGLKNDLKNGLISNLILQPEFPLLPSFKDIRTGTTKKGDALVVRGVKYIADFQYQKDGQIIVEDVKSKITAKEPLFKLKWKLLLWKYKDIQFRIIM